MLIKIIQLIKKRIGKIIGKERRDSLLQLYKDGYNYGMREDANPDLATIEKFLLSMIPPSCEPYRTNHFSMVTGIKSACKIRFGTSLDYI